MKDNNTDNTDNTEDPKDLVSPTESESAEMFKVAIHRGTHRLNRPGVEMTLAGIIAGMNVTFGALAAAAVSGAVISSFGESHIVFADVVGALVFPIGFVFVVLGRSELFTENFLVPTTAVIAKKSTFSCLLKLWSLTLIGNLIGAMVVAKLLSLEFYDGVPAVHAVQHIQHVAEFLVLERDWDASFFSAVFAGWLITLMTWLLLTTDNTLSKIAIIWCVGFMIMLNKFNHVIVNTSEILMSIFAGNTHITYSMWLQHSFVPTILGNMIGGLVFVTLLEYIKVLYSQERWK